MKRISKILSFGMRGTGADNQEDHWVVGGRYQVLQGTNLHVRPDIASENRGKLRAKDTVLLLAVQSVPAASGQGEALLAYVANTKTQDWVSGWALIESSPDAPPVLLRRLQRSWELGGRYVVNGSPVLRAGIELESEQICEMVPNGEVLVLELGLVIRSSEPRLRARVRVDSSEEGWLTIELPGGDALLNPLNLFRAEAFQKKASLFGERHRKSGLSRRVTLNGQLESSNQAWEVGGKYRLVENAVVHVDVELESEAIGELRKGSLVIVKGLDHVLRLSGSSFLRLQISNEHTDAIGWLSPLSSKGEKLLDSRDHLEFDKIMRLHALAKEQSQQDASHEEEELGPQDFGEAGRLARLTEEQSADAESSDRHLLRQSAPAVFAQTSPLSFTPPHQAAPSSDGHSPLSPPAPWDNAYTPQAALPESGTPGSSNMFTMTPVASPQRGAPDISLMSDHMRNKGGEAQQKYPVFVGSSYRNWRDMDASEDERHVSDNLEDEGYGNVCCGRGALMTCSAVRMWPSASKGAPIAPYPTSQNMMGEPAPEPRPAYGMPTPPAVHATAMPNYYGGLNF